MTLKKLKRESWSEITVKRRDPDGSEHEVIKKTKSKESVILPDSSEPRVFWTILLNAAAPFLASYIMGVSMDVPALLTPPVVAEEHHSDVPGCYWEEVPEME